MLYERLWSACRRAGLCRMRWHDCRHGFASQLVIAGTPLRRVQEWLGHSAEQGALPRAVDIPNYAPMIGLIVALSTY